MRLLPSQGCMRLLQSNFGYPLGLDLGVSRMSDMEGAPGKGCSADLCAPYGADAENCQSIGLRSPTSTCHVIAIASVARTRSKGREHRHPCCVLASNILAFAVGARPECQILTSVRFPSALMTRLAIRLRADTVAKLFWAPERATLIQ
jgi:hypothetical protein